MIELTDAGTEVLLAVEKMTKMANRIEDLEGEILYLKGSLGKWTKDPPNKPGWYWAIERFPTHPEIVEVVIAGEDEKLEPILKVLLISETAALKLSDIRLWWSIPIMEPPKPEK